MDQFIDGGFKPVEYDGRLVYPDYWMDLEMGDVVQIQWLSAALRKRKASSFVFGSRTGPAGKVKVDRCNRENSRAYRSGFG